MKSPTEQYEIFTDDLGEGRKLIRGIRCRWCSWELQMEGFNEAFKGIALLEMIAPVVAAGFYSYGHALTCQAPKGN